jgi:hypothetical protein
VLLERVIVRALKRGVQSPILKVFRKDDPPAIARLELMAS